MANALDHVSHKVTSTEELLAIAHAMEIEAARRYHDLAARMLRRGDQKLAGLFSFLSGIEQKHAHQICEHAVKITGRAPDAAQIRWALPENFDEEEASSRLLTPYLALAIAVRNEERAFAFYCYVAAEAADHEIRAFAEESAKEELNHATLLRRERRKAYRDETRAGRPTRRAAIPETVAEFLTHAVEMENTAARYHKNLAGMLASSDEAAARSFARAADDEAQTTALLSDRLDVAPSEHALTVATTVEDGLRILEEVFEFYADVSERSDDEGIIHEAQALAERAVRRLALAQGSMNEVAFDAS